MYINYLVYISTHFAQLKKSRLLIRRAVYKIDIVINPDNCWKTNLNVFNSFFFFNNKESVISTSSNTYKLVLTHILERKEENFRSRLKMGS